MPTFARRSNPGRARSRATMQSTARSRLDFYRSDRYRTTRDYNRYGTTDPHDPERGEGPSGAAGDGVHHARQRYIDAQRRTLGPLMSVRTHPTLELPSRFRPIPLLKPDEVRRRVRQLGRDRRLVEGQRFNRHSGQIGVDAAASRGREVKDMSELVCLELSVLLWIVHVLVQAYMANEEFGLAYLLSPRDERPTREALPAGERRGRSTTMSRTSFRSSPLRWR